MSEGIGFFDGILAEMLSNIHTAMPCKVESYNESKGAADVVPLFMRKFKNQSPEPLPKLVNVPVTKRKYKLPDETIKVENTYYEPGDIVLVVFAERALDNALATGQISDPRYNRKHALEDGIIIGLLR